jgi:curved DNA-binding protein CbpA
MRTAKDPLGYYHLLDLAPDSDTAEIRAAFRRAAKRFHPDQGGPDADEARFHAIREAYDVLRDPARRLAYDADRLDEGKRAGGASQPTGGSAQSNSFRFNLPFAVVAGLLAVAVAVIAFLSLQIGGRDERIAELQLALADAAKTEAAMAARLRAQNFQSLNTVLDSGSGNASIFQADVRFRAGEMILDPNGQVTLDKDLLAMTGVIERIPDGRDWMILIESEVPRAASEGGAEVAPWETGLLRLAGIVEHLAALGLPEERIAARFQAGFGLDGRRSVDLNRVQIKLLCCLK